MNNEINLALSIIRVEAVRAAMPDLSKSLNAAANTLEFRNEFFTKNFTNCTTINEAESVMSAILKSTEQEKAHLEEAYRYAKARLFEVKAVAERIRDFGKTVDILENLIASIEKDAAELGITE